MSAKGINSEIFSNNTTLIERTQHEESPYMLVKQGDEWFAAIGNNRVTEKYETKEELEEKIGKKDWDTIYNTIAVIAKSIIREIMEADQAQLEKMAEKLKEEEDTREAGEVAEKMATLINKTKN